MTNETLITQEGLQKLKDELNELKSVRRIEISQRIKEAIALGDLSENAEYDAAKNEQGIIEGRTAELEAKIRTAKIIKETDDGSDKVHWFQSHPGRCRNGGPLRLHRRRYGRSRSVQRPHFQ